MARKSSLAVALCSVAALAQPTVTLDPATSPNPLVIDAAAVPTSKSSMDRFASCKNRSDTRLSEAPVAKLVITAPTKLRVTSVEAGLITLPGNRFRCFEHTTIGKHGPLLVAEVLFEAGTYEIYPMGNGRPQATHLEFTLVDRVPADVTARLAAAPPLELKSDGSPNPSYREFDLGPAFAPEHLRLDCAQKQAVVPLTRLEVVQASSWKLAVPQHEVYLQAADGKCLRGGGDLPKGSYAVFIDERPDLAETRAALSIFDLERGLLFGEAPHVELGALTTPLPIEVTVPAAESRAPVLCGVGAREPSFFLDVKKARAGAWLSTLVGEKLTWTVAGPLKTTQRQSDWCRTGPEVSWDKLEPGTYAVWVSGAKAAEGRKAWGQLRARVEDPVARQKAEGDALAKLRPVPAELPLAERGVWAHYPWYPRESKAVEALFLDAPASLFVFVASDVGELVAGEPLLLEAHGDEKSLVIRMTGERVSVRTERLVVEKPAAVVLPAQWPELTRPKELKDAWDLASPSDGLKLARWESMDEKRRACVGSWMAKNDPTWGKSYELVNVRTGRTVSDQKFKQAEAVCKGAAVDAAARALTNELFQGRLALREKLEKALPAKFK